MGKSKVGRPRSERAREAILTATGDLLDETGGSRLNVEAIARRAGVGKPTIYRWWSSPADIALEVVLGRADAEIRIPLDIPPGEALREFLRRSMTALDGRNGAHLRCLMAHAQTDPAFRERFRTRFTERRRAALKSVLARLREDDLIDPARDLDLASDIVFGVMWYRLLVGHAPLDEALADDLTRATLARRRRGADGPRPPMAVPSAPAML